MWRVALGILALFAAGCSGPADDPCAGDPAPGIVCRVAGTGEFGFNGDGRPAPESDLYLVSAARRGPDGDIYVMDFNNQRLRVIDGVTGTMRTIAGNGFHAYATEDIPALDSPLENPVDFGFLPSGDVVFVSLHDPRVLTIDDGGYLRVLAGSFEAAERGDEGDGGPALEARFMELNGIAVAPDGTIYLADGPASRVRRIKDGVIETVAGDGEEAYTGDGGPGTEASLHYPTALELDAAGNLYIADSLNHAVRKLSPDGVITTVPGTGPGAAAGSEGQPVGLAIEADGTLYVAEREAFCVRRVSPDGSVEVIAGNGERGLAGDGGRALDAEFGFLLRIALDGDSLLVADQTESCVRRVILR
ncbi:MAG: SMP-30/gluconolactonase/LRE family protein [Myxococcales bacterium]|nr:SMP-30/gluconolactonase/LRE family protein [Myxococcales bacterium]MCB9732176.1 SMP-30/gluconolactonase/LRE family protein [Deltaproteobacteria bacterium]